MAKSMSGSLQVRNGIYYLVKRIPDENGIMKQKWVSLNLPQKGTTKREVENRKIEMNRISTEKDEKELVTK